jgi:hypothetical protein
MYVGYDGNYGSAEDCDFVIFDGDDLTNEQMDLLENDPTEFYFAISGNGWGCLEEEGVSV